MAKYKQKSLNVISFVLMIAFAFLVAVTGYVMVKGGSFELRSKAAQQEVILKQWTFQKGNEGWDAADFLSAIVEGGNYSLVVGPKTEEVRYGEEECTGSEKRGNYRCKTPSSTYVLSPKINHNAVNVILKYPLNRFNIRLTLSSLPSGIKPSPICELEPPCAYLKTPCKYAQQGVTYCPRADQPAGTYTGGGGVPPSGIQRVFKVPFQISYRLQGKNTDEAPVTIMALADGAMHDYSFNFPKELSLKKIVSMKISFAALRTQAKARVNIADMSIVGLPTVTKVPPNPAKTYRGALSTVNSAGGTPIVDALYPYQLIVPAPGGVRSPGTRYLLSNEAGVDFNFKKYVDKQVVVVGVLKSEDYDERAGVRLPGESLPILIVSKISLAVAPTVSPNPAKTYRGVVRKSIFDDGGTYPYRLDVSNGGGATTEYVLSSTPGGNFNFGNYVGKDVVVEGILGEEYTDSQAGMKAPGSSSGPYVLIVSKISLANPLGYTCPANTWVNCMPGPNTGVRLECTPKYLSWADANCPGFEGAAY